MLARLFRLLIGLVNDFLDGLFPFFGIHGCCSPRGIPHHQFYLLTGLRFPHPDILPANPIDTLNTVTRQGGLRILSPAATEP